MSFLHPTQERSYDLIFAGGGASACLVAGRLIEADPTLKILILEQGPTTRDLPNHVQPGRVFTHLSPLSKTVTHNVGRPSAALNGRSPIVQSGRCVGGGSSVNFMLYIRASASDYDDWEKIYQNPGWGSKDLIPLLRKTENYQVNPSTPQETHGYSGRLAVSHGGLYTKIGKSFLKTAAVYDKDRKGGEECDVNGMWDCDVYGRWPKWIDGKTGRRSDVPHHFIYNHPEIEVRDGCRVKKVLIENGHAVGVEYVPESTTESIIVRCNKMVVLGAGAYGSPTILQQSGIGPKDVLEKAGVDVSVELDGVGKNYKDHNAISSGYYTADDVETMWDVTAADEPTMRALEEQWQKDGSGILAANFFDAGIKIRPNARDLLSIGPSFTKRWENYFATPGAKDKCVMFIGSLSASRSQTVPSPRQWRFACYTAYPESTGFVNISDAKGGMDFHAGYLEIDGDVALLVWAYKKSRELARRMDVFRGEVKAEHPPFAEGSAAQTSGLVTQEKDGETLNIEYSEEDDAVITQWVRDVVSTTWHSMGTCAMKPREEGGVVDFKLNVYGVEGLKVADLSICPANVGANTYSTALVIGEKAAVLIANELGLSL